MFPISKRPQREANDFFFDMTARLLSHRTAVQPSTTPGSGTHSQVFAVARHETEPAKISHRSLCFV